MRTKEECKSVLQLKHENLNHCQIYRATNIPRRTIIDIVNRFKSSDEIDDYFNGRIGKDDEIDFEQFFCDENVKKSYAYILGWYLGDGYINETPRTYRLRIYSTGHHFNTIEMIKKNLAILFPKNDISVLKQKKANCVEVYVHSNMLKSLFPQYGKGKKSTRLIELTDWQNIIVEKYSKDFLMGLIQSDGCRVNCQYPRYEFTNTSKDIIDIYCKTCENLEVDYKMRKLSNILEPRSQSWIVAISKRKSVNYIDSFVPLIQ